MATQLNNPTTVETEIGGRKLTIETGRLAKQANGSVYIKYGDTSALVTAVAKEDPGEDLGFFPLTIEMQEKFYAMGKIPGGFFKKETRPSDLATLNARMVDRPLRPLFPEGFRSQTQIVFTLLSYDNENEMEVMAGLGASAALMISDIPFDNAIATVRVGRIDGEYVINPTPKDQEKSEINVIVSGTEDAIVMVEGGAENVSEEVFLDGLFFAHDKIKGLIQIQKDLQAKVGKTKWTVTPPEKDEALYADVKTFALAGFKECFSEVEKMARYKKLDTHKKSVVAHFSDKLADDSDLAVKVKDVKKAYDAAKKSFARELTISEGRRIDGRKFDEVRTIETEVGFLPRVHGSALFTRGETQGLITITLGTSDDEQMIDNVRGNSTKKFMLHYNFPPYCVGETGRFGGGSRREIGHGMLAERAVSAIIPSYENFGYTIRVVSEVLESNGSSSMASVCGASMALMDAGVPVKQAVAGIAMGMMQEGDQTVVLSDILGDEDHLGDMDFKVCGTKEGLTAVQMDIKMTGVSKELLTKALMQARAGRLHILKEMEKSINSSRTDMSEFAPKIEKIRVKPEKIKDIIGPGGKVIKNIVATTGVKIDIDDEGIVSIASVDPVAFKKAKSMIEELTAEAEVGKIYMGTVAKVMEYGAFVTVIPGVDGLCHISELDDKRVERVEDIVQEGDKIPVKVLEVDRFGKIKLSRRAAIAEQ